jgi:hypothetical protein
LSVISVAGQKNVREKNKRLYFSLLHFSIRLVLPPETTVEASLTEAQWEKLCKA